MTRSTWVSTAMPSFDPVGVAQHHVRRLAADPRQRDHRRDGRGAPRRRARSTSPFAKPMRLFVFARKKPVERMISSTSAGAACGQRCGVGKRAKSCGRHQVDALVGALGREDRGHRPARRRCGSRARSALRGAPARGGRGSARPAPRWAWEPRGGPWAVSPRACVGVGAGPGASSRGRPSRAGLYQRLELAQGGPKSRGKERGLRAGAVQARQPNLDRPDDPAGSSNGSARARTTRRPSPRRRRPGVMLSLRRRLSVGASDLDGHAAAAARPKGRSRRQARRARPSSTSSRARRSVRRSRIVASSWTQGGGAETATGSSPSPRAACPRRWAATGPTIAARVASSACGHLPEGRETGLLERVLEMLRQVAERRQGLAGQERGFVAGQDEQEAARPGPARTRRARRAARRRDPARRRGRAGAGARP